MSFPVVVHLFGLNLPAHLICETLAYAIGFRLYLWLRARSADPISDAGRLTVLAGAIIGAALGSKLLAFAEHPELWRLAAGNPVYVLGAKTILGALLGGILGVEIVKTFAGIRTSTGDLYVFPLLVAIMIGRVGCLLTGVSDGTWGDATHFIFGFDAGDGVVRHATPLYEIVFLMALGGALWWARRRLPLRNGDLFKLFIMGYCAWRFAIEYLKPVTTYALTNRLNVVQNIATDTVMHGEPGVSILQMAALMGFLAYAVYFIWRGWGQSAWRRATISSSN